MHKNIVAAAVIAGLAGCSSGADVGSAEAEESIYAVTSSLWPSARHSDRTTLGVCFQTPGWSRERAWVRDAIVKTWGGAAKIDFVGFGDCRVLPGGDVTVIGGTPENIRIFIEDDKPKIFGDLGTEIDRVRLNFTYLNFRDWCSASEADREFCIRADAIHEVGHALGLAHEQNRPDAPCTAEDNGQYGDTYWQYDPDSVMNYCAAMRTTLSPLDRAGIQTLYGGRGTFTNEYYALWNHKTLRFSFLTTAPRSTNQVVSSSATISQVNKVQVIRVGGSASTQRLAYGDKVQIKGATIINNQPYYIGPAGATRTAFEWTVGRTDGSTTRTALDIRSPFVLSGLNASGQRVYLSSGGSSTSQSESTEWRLIAGPANAPRDD